MPTLTDDARLARATAHFDLIVDALRLMGELGVDITQLMPAAIETTATAAPAEPAKETELVSDEVRSPTEQKSSETTSVAAPPKPPTVDDAF